MTREHSFSSLATVYHSGKQEYLIYHSTVVTLHEAITTQGAITMPCLKTMEKSGMVAMVTILAEQ